MKTDHKSHILSHSDILLKIERMAWEVLELNPGATEVIICGVESKGRQIANLIEAELAKISSIHVSHGSIAINKEDPNRGELTLSGSDKITGKHVILADDVLNSGRTLMYATVPILKESPLSLHTLILANRDHASFPIKANIVGVSLATTLQEHITFQVDDDGQMSVYLI